MKKIILILLIGGFNAQLAFSQSAAPLANQHGCVACHKVDEKLVGPGFRDIAAKYKDQPDALQTLSQKVKKGGAGNWGRIPMPAHPQLNDETLNALVSWILKGAPN